MGCPIISEDESNIPISFLWSILSNAALRSKSTNIAYFIYTILGWLTLAPLSQENKQQQGVTRLSTWTKGGGIWTDAWVCLHFWVVVWVAG